MPELPEVEEVRRTLEPHILGKRIVAVRALRRDFLTPPAAPLERLAGHKFARTFRHGKKLFCIVDDEQTLLFHLGMTGRIDAVAHTTPHEPHTHFLLELQQQRDIRFVDPRRFGGVWYYPSLAQALAAEVEGRMGPDALTLEAKDLAHWKKASGKLKSRLLSQRDVAGLGNIYVDEALWLARLHPLQRVRGFQAHPWPCLWRRSIRSCSGRLPPVAQLCVIIGTSQAQSGAFAAQLQAYGRGGEPCFRCGSPLKSLLVVARTTVFCPTCQTRR